LRGGHERISFVLVVGALGLPEQRGDARQHLVVSHGARLGLLADKAVERSDHLWRKRPRLGEVGDAVAGIIVQHMVDALEFDDLGAVCLR
jgi:hypothetical protein